MDRDLESKPIKDKAVLHQSDVLPGTFKQRHLEANLYAIKFGLAADRPTSPGTNSHYFAYFATDTFVFSCWTGSAWKTTTLS